MSKGWRNLPTGMLAEWRETVLKAQLLAVNPVPIEVSREYNLMTKIKGHGANRTVMNKTMSGNTICKLVPGMRGMSAHFTMATSFMETSTEPMSKLHH